MSHETQVAARCFRENIEQFGDSNTSPEKYNLYTGLLNLAHAIEKIEREISNIKQQVK